ncbi:MAG: hypothetical protein R3B96_05960 [Pirellulaceae bacterium]|nr:hypothetical protein [Planctomycetales bacterium]
MTRNDVLGTVYPKRRSRESLAQVMASVVSQGRTITTGRMLATFDGNMLEWKGMTL